MSEKLLRDITSLDELVNGQVIPRAAAFKLRNVDYADSDGEVVCATKYRSVALFMALAPRIPNVHWGYKLNTYGGVDFFLHPRQRDLMWAAAGYLLTLDMASGFVPHDCRYPESYPVATNSAFPRRVPEFRSSQAQKQIERPESVTFRDFEAEILTSTADQLYFRVLPPITSTA